MQFSQDYLKSRFDYDPITGQFTWKAVPVLSHFNKIWNTRYAGKSAGRINRWGYLAINLDGRICTHINTIRHDNRWCNLREATPSENLCNRSKTSQNTSGFKGVSWNKRQKVWFAQITHLGKAHFLGNYQTPEEAHSAYIEAANELHGEYAHS